MEKKLRYALRMALCILLSLTLVAGNCLAASSEGRIPVTNRYESTKEYSLQESDRVSRGFVYGLPALGELILQGGEVEEKEYHQERAFVVNYSSQGEACVVGLPYPGEITYQVILPDFAKGKSIFGGCFMGKDSAKTVLGHPLKHKIDRGAILVEKEYFDGNTGSWKKQEQSEVFWDVFGSDQPPVIKVTNADTFFGTCFTISLFYQMKKRQKDSRFLMIDLSDYQKYYEVEQYRFYVFDELSYERIYPEGREKGEMEDSLEATEKGAFAGEDIGELDLKALYEAQEEQMFIKNMYYATAQACLDQCFDENGCFRFAAIEVPADQYDWIVGEVEKKVSAGEVPNIDSPEMVKDFIKKGIISFHQAVDLVKTGKISFVQYDEQKNYISVMKDLGLSVILTYAMSIWRGEEKEDALRNAFYAGIQMGGDKFISTVINTPATYYALNKMMVAGTDMLVAHTYHVSKDFVNFVANLGREEGAIWGAASIRHVAKLLRTGVISAGIGALSLAVLSLGDIMDMAGGRISKKQLAKNVAVEIGRVGLMGVGSMVGSSLLGPALAGAAAGSVIPGLGNVVGGVVGGALGYFVLPKLADVFVSDDSKEMWEIVDQELISLTGEYLLTDREQLVMLEILQDTIDEKLLENMYANGNHEEFARTQILDPVLKQILGARRQIELPSQEEMTSVTLEAISVLYDEGAFQNLEANE